MHGRGLHSMELSSTAFSSAHFLIVPYFFLLLCYYLGPTWSWYNDSRVLTLGFPPPLFPECLPLFVSSTIAITFLCNPFVLHVIPLHITLYKYYATQYTY